MIKGKTYDQATLITREQETIFIFRLEIKDIIIIILANVRSMIIPALLISQQR